MIFVYWDEQLDINVDKVSYSKTGRPSVIKRKVYKTDEGEKVFNIIFEEMPFGNFDLKTDLTPDLTCDVGCMARLLLMIEPELKGQQLIVSDCITGHSIFDVPELSDFIRKHSKNMITLRVPFDERDVSMMVSMFGAKMMHLKGNPVLDYHKPFGVLKLPK